MNLKLYEKVYTGLKQFILDNSELSPHVLKKPSGDLFPKVVVEEISNTSISNAGFMESVSLLGFEINIYAKDIGAMDSMEVARSLTDLVSRYMDNQMKFKRIMAKPTPNVDDTIYRITMRYVTQASDYRGHFF